MQTYVSGGWPASLKGCELRGAWGGRRRRREGGGEGRGGKCQGRERVLVEGQQREERGGLCARVGVGGCAATGGPSIAARSPTHTQSEQRCNDAPAVQQQHAVDGGAVGVQLHVLRQQRRGAGLERPLVVQRRGGGAEAAEEQQDVALRDARAGRAGGRGRERGGAATQVGRSSARGRQGREAAAAPPRPLAHPRPQPAALQTATRAVVEPLGPAPLAGATFCEEGGAVRGRMRCGRRGADRGWRQGGREERGLAATSSCWSVGAI